MDERVMKALDMCAPGTRMAGLGAVAASCQPQQRPVARGSQRALLTILPPRSGTPSKSRSTAKTFG